jgi:hypothetical protein
MGTNMIKFSALALALGFSLLAAPAQAQSRTDGKPAPRPTINLKAPNASPSGSFIRCRIVDAAMTAEGLGFTCLTSSNQRYLVASDGGKLPGGISAMTSLVIEMMEQPNHYRRIRIKEAKGGALRVCGLVRGTSAAKDGRTCVQALSVRMSTKDSPVGTSDANPDGPNIPTGDANPNGPTIPTRPASPD